MNEQQKKCLEIAECFEFMPGNNPSRSQSELPTLFLKHPIIDSVTFFGGSFNPFHEGHRACLDLCPEKNILIVPDRNPFKVEEQNTTSKAYSDFLALAEVLKDTPYSLYPGFLALEQVNPTSSWIAAVKMKEVNFLMGDDSYMSLLTWKNPEIIVRALTKLYVVPRRFSREDYLKQELELKKWNPSLDVHYLADHPYKNLSSSELRGR